MFWCQNDLGRRSGQPSARPRDACPYPTPSTPALPLSPRPRAESISYVFPLSHTSTHTTTRTRVHPCTHIHMYVHQHTYTCAYYTLSYTHSVLMEQQVLQEAVYYGRLKDDTPDVLRAVLALRGQAVGRWNPLILGSAAGGGGGAPAAAGGAPQPSNAAAAVRQPPTVVPLAAAFNSAVASQLAYVYRCGRWKLIPHTFKYSCACVFDW